MKGSILSSLVAMTVAPLRMAKGGIRISRRDISEAKKLEARYGELLESVHAIVGRVEGPTFQTTYAGKHAGGRTRCFFSLKHILNRKRLSRSFRVPRKILTSPLRKDPHDFEQEGILARQFVYMTNTVRFLQDETILLQRGKYSR